MYEPELFAEIARLRYEVYCAERNYLDPAEYTSGLEIDHFEERSIHIAAQNLDGLLIGTVRLVLAGADQDFPFEDHCEAYPDIEPPPREQCGEVSRLIVKKSFRVCSCDSLRGLAEDFEEEGSVAAAEALKRNLSGSNRRISSSLIMLGMYREIYRYSRREGIRYWYAAMEKGLVRLIEGMGFRFAPIGPEADYYGPVTLHVADLREIELSLLRANPSLLAWFQDEDVVELRFIANTVKFSISRLGRV